MKTLRLACLACFLLFMRAAHTSQANGINVSPVCINMDTLPSKSTQEVDTALFIRVEEEASFPGGQQAWMSFLERYLKADVPVKRKAPVGQYLVVVQFIVDQKGELSDIKPLTAHGYGMENELIRVLKKSPRWKPAQMNGRAVKAYRKQPLTFVVAAEK